MAKVTVVVGPQGSGKTREISKLVSGVKTMFVGSIAVNSLAKDPFHMQRLLLKAAEMNTKIVVIEQLWVNRELLRSILLALILVGYPVEVIIETQLQKADIPFQEFLDIIELRLPQNG